MRYIAGAYARKGEPALARDWYLRAVAEAPWLREPYVDLAFLLYEQEKWDGVLYFTGCALEIENRPESYICEADAWGSLPHDLRCQAFYKTGRAKEALTEAERRFRCRRPTSGWRGMCGCYGKACKIFRSPSTFRGVEAPFLLGSVSRERTSANLGPGAFGSWQSPETESLVHQSETLSLP